MAKKGRWLTRSAAAAKASGGRICTLLGVDNHSEPPCDKVLTRWIHRG